MEREIELLKSAVAEINMLRNQNQLMSARLDMFDSMMSVLHTDVARKSVGMSPDLVREIEKFVQKENTVEKISVNKL